MATTQIRPATTWQSLGIGPLDIQVLTGTIVLQAADRRPASVDIAGTIVTASGGAPAAHLDASEWWAKALVTETVMTITTAASTSRGGTDGGAVSTGFDGSGVAGAVLAGASIVSLAADGTLLPASSSDAMQFGRVAGFTRLSAALGSPVSFTRHDSLTNSAWALTPGPVFVGANGGVTQVEPTIGFVQVAGLAVSATTIVADFGSPTLL